MKTIQISDEDYEFLVEAQNLLKTQDNRCTADPLYCVMSKKRVYGLDTDYASDYEWYNSSYSKSTETTEDLFEELIDDEEYLSELVDIYNDENEYLDPENKESIPILRKWFLEEVEDYYNALLDYLESKDYKKVYYVEQQEISQHSNVFSLFEQDAVDFVRAKNGQIDLAKDAVPEGRNRNDFNSMWSYAESSWRATRMNRLRKIVKEIKLDAENL